MSITGLFLEYVDDHHKKMEERAKEKGLDVKRRLRFYHVIKTDKKETSMIKKRVVIAGMGFGGIRAARVLAGNRG